MYLRIKNYKINGFFSRTWSPRFSWLEEGSCTVSGWAVFTWEKLSFCSRGKGNNAASQEGGKGRAEDQLVQWKLNNIFVCSTDSIFSVFYPLLQLPLMQINPSSASFQSTNLLCTSSLSFIYLGELSWGTASVKFLLFTRNDCIQRHVGIIWFR